MAFLPVLGQTLPLQPLKSHLPAFLLSYWAIFVLHLSRKSYAGSKVELVNGQWFHAQGVFSTTDEQSQMASLLDTAFLLLYAVGLFFRWD